MVSSVNPSLKYPIRIAGQIRMASRPVESDRPDPMSRPLLSNSRTFNAKAIAARHRAPRPSSTGRARQAIARPHPGDQNERRRAPAALRARLLTAFGLFQAPLDHRTNRALGTGARHGPRISAPRQRARWSSRLKTAWHRSHFKDQHRAPEDVAGPPPRRASAPAPSRRAFQPRHQRAPPT